MNREENNYMKFSQSSIVYFNYTLKYCLVDLQKLGYKGIEVWGGRPHMYRHDLDDVIHEIKEFVAIHDMDVVNFVPAQFRYPSILCSENERARKDSIEYIKDAADNALKLGAPSVSLCPGMVAFNESVETGWKKLLKSFEEIDEYCSGKNIFLLIEPAHRFESNLILTVDDCLRMLDELGSDRFGVLIDSGHVNINGENFSDIIKKCKGIPLHIHLDDNMGDTDSHLIPGRGNVDFNSLFEALDLYGYNGYVSGELGGIYNMDPTSACIETIEFLKKYYKQ